MTGIAGIESVQFTEPNTIRLIPTAYIDGPAMAPLVDDDDDLTVLEALETLTSARHRPRLSVPGGLNMQELLSEAHGYGWTYVNAAFCYTRATGNRFNGPDRGAWYAAYGEDAIATAQAEVAWHLSRELEATGVYENSTSYRELIAGFTCDFHDLHGTDHVDALLGNPQTAYPAGQAIAAKVLADGGNGVLYPSARRSGGKCLAAFRPYLVQNVRLGDTWMFEWDGNVVPNIRKIP